MNGSISRTKHTLGVSMNASEEVANSAAAASSGVQQRRRPFILMCVLYEKEDVICAPCNFLQE